MARFLLSRIEKFSYKSVGYGKPKITKAQALALQKLARDCDYMALILRLENYINRRIGVASQVLPAAYTRPRTKAIPPAQWTPTAMPVTKRRG